MQLFVFCAVVCAYMYSLFFLCMYDNKNTLVSKNKKQANIGEKVAVYKGPYKKLLAHLIQKYDRTTSGGMAASQGVIFIAMLMVYQHVTEGKYVATETCSVSYLFL